MTIVLIIVGWLACGFVAAGLLVAHIQNEWPLVAEEDYYDDLRWSLMLSLFGPFTLFVSLLMCEWWRYGWSLGRAK